MSTFDLQLPVRLHSNIARHTWAKLWYFCRAIDTQGRGLVVLNWTDLRTQLKAQASTLYEWLRTGKKAGAFLHYQRSGDTLVLHLGAKWKICRNLKLKSWGFTAVVELVDVLLNLRSWATALVTQGLQDASYRLASKQLTGKERKVFKVPSSNDLFGENLPSPKTPERGNKISYLQHETEKSFFVNRATITHGVCQDRIGEELGVTSRTVYRHLKQLEIRRKQIFQQKGDYQSLYVGLLNDAPEVYGDSKEARYLEHPTDERSRILIDHNILYRNALPYYSVISLDRFYIWGGKVWLRKTNLYEDNLIVFREKEQLRSFRKKIRYSYKDEWQELYDWVLTGAWHPKEAYGMTTKELHMEARRQVYKAKMQQNFTKRAGAAWTDLNKSGL